jgi:hypothetical protein
MITQPQYFNAFKKLLNFYFRHLLLLPFLNESFFLKLFFPVQTFKFLKLRYIDFRYSNIGEQSLYLFGKCSPRKCFSRFLSTLSLLFDDCEKTQN